MLVQNVYNQVDSEIKGGMLADILARHQRNKKIDKTWSDVRGCVRENERVSPVYKTQFRRNLRVLFFPPHIKMDMKPSTTRRKKRKYTKYHRKAIQDSADNIWFPVLTLRQVKKKGKETSLILIDVPTGLNLVVFHINKARGQSQAKGHFTLLLSLYFYDFEKYGRA